MALRPRNAALSESASELRVMSLCSGVGGLDLAVHLAVPRARTVVYVEREAYAAATLVARMEDETLDRAPVWDDLKSFDGRPWRGRVDCIVGGYPCQPFSVAGSRKGTADERHLWPWIATLIDEVQPALCFFENVPGHVALGLREVLEDIESLGYRVVGHDEAPTFGLFTAKEVGAPHKRERLFILAVRVADAENPERGPMLPGSVGHRHGCGRGEAHVPTGGGGAEVRTSEGLDDAAGARYDGTGERAGSDERGGERLPCEGRAEVRTSEGLADGEGLSEREPHDAERPEPREYARPDLGGVCGGVPAPDAERRGDAEGERLEGRGDCGLGGTYERLAWPPGRENDDARWLYTLRHEPWLAPATEGVPEPTLRRMVDGPPARADRLRACGNGVVPLEGAYAFRTLGTIAGIESLWADEWGVEDPEGV